MSLTQRLLTRSPRSLIRWAKGLLYSPLPYGVSQAIDRFARPETWPIARQLAAEARELEAIFIHIPKVAGSSIRIGLFGEEYFGGHQSVGVFMLGLPRDEFDRLFKFCFVRNPWDRVHSAYRYLSRGGTNDQDRTWAERELAGVRDFDDFLLNRLARPEVMSFIHFRPQVEWITDPGGTLRIDMIGRYESLHRDFETVSQRLGRADATLPWVNRTPGSKRDFRDAYSTEGVEVVSELYKEDIELFGYSFEEGLTTSGD